MRFLHIADVHLGARPDAGFPWSERRMREIRESFEGIIQVAKRERPELLLIAGDLFHRQPLYGELKEVNALFSEILDTRVVLMAGNHDYLKKDAYYPRFPWSKNVVGLWEERCRCIRLPELGVFLYGLSYGSREIEEGLYDQARPLREEGFHILLAHGGDSRHIPLDFAALKKAGFDYVALGHIHKPQILGSRMAYAGALEPLERNDQGPHGYIRGEMTKEGTKIQFVPFSRRRYLTLEIPLDQEVTQRFLERQVEEEIRKRGEDHIYQLRFTGIRPPSFQPDLDRLRELGNVLSAEDLSVPDLQLDRLLKRYDGTLVGEYIRYFQERPQGPVEKKALYYGLQALLGESL